MVWITSRIARIRHPIRGKSDDLTYRSDRFELAPVPTRFPLRSGPNSEIEVASSRSLIGAARHRYRNGENSGYPNPGGGRPILVKRQLVYDSVNSNTLPFASAPQGASVRSTIGPSSAMRTCLISIYLGIGASRLLAILATM
jgi:hypothetical protein